MALYAAFDLLMCIGTWQLHLRAIGGCCLCLIGCVNIAAIIVTGVFRMNDVGTLAAMSLTPSKYSGEPFDNTSGTMIVSNMSDDRTYSSDGQLIFIVWICQMVFCCSQCCVMGYLAKPPNADALRHSMAQATAGQDKMGYTPV